MILEGEYEKEQNFKFEKTDYKIGEEIKGYNLILVVNNIKDYDELVKTWVPDEGHKYLAIDITIKNFILLAS